MDARTKVIEPVDAQVLLIIDPAESRLENHTEPEDFVLTKLSPATWPVETNGDVLTPERTPPEDTPASELKPHPCTLPAPQFLTTEGITCKTGTFLVDSLPPTYPYLPFHSSRPRTSAKFQIPFFVFSGPDPPPADIAYLGDVYVAPEASALYAYLPVDEIMGGGAWTRWTAVGPEEHARNLTSGEVALLRHPYFPEHILWTRERTFSWYSLGSINNLRREARNKKLFIANEDAEAAAKILVARALQDAEGKHSKKRRADDKEEPRKKARVRAAAVKSEEIVAPSGAFAGAQEGPAQAEWDALYAKPRTSTRATKQIQDQTAIIARLEAENEALRTKLANEKQLAVQRMPLSLHPEFLGFMRETLACEVMLTCNAQRIEAEIAAVHAEGQVSTLTAALKKAKAEYAAEINRMKTSGVTAKVADGAALQLAGVYLSGAQNTIALNEAEIRRLNESSQSYRSEIEQLKAELAQARENLTEARATPAPGANISRLESKSGPLPTTDATAALQLTQAGLSDAQSRIWELEREIHRLKQASQHETDALRRILAAREAQS